MIFCDFGRFGVILGELLGRIFLTCQFLNIKEPWKLLRYSGVILSEEFLMFERIIWD